MALAASSMPPAANANFLAIVHMIASSRKKPGSLNSLGSPAVARLSRHKLGGAKKARPCQKKTPQMADPRRQEGVLTALCSAAKLPGRHDADTFILSIFTVQHLISAFRRMGAVDGATSG
jgi:hypothetical protein